MPHTKLEIVDCEYTVETTQSEKKLIFITGWSHCGNGT